MKEEELTVAQAECLDVVAVWEPGHPDLLVPIGRQHEPGEEVVEKRRAEEEEKRRRKR